MQMTGNCQVEMRTVWKNEIKIVNAISTDINMKFGIENCARMFLKQVGSKAKCIQEEHFRRTLKNWTPQETYKNLGTAESHDREHKNDKETSKKEYLRRLTLVLDTELS